MPAKKKTAAKKIAKAKAEKPAPTDAMIDAAVDLTDELNECICDLDDAACAEDVEEFNEAVADAAKKLARAMTSMAKLAAKLDPAAFAVAQAKASQLPAVRAPSAIQ